MKQLKEQFLTEIAGTCGPYPGQVRAAQPLVHLLTNYVTVTDCVNAVLAAGGKAICSHALQEAAAVTAGSDALVLNLGATEYYEAMLLSARQALKSGIPVVIDPVGCAASDFRRIMCRELVQKYHPAAVRGNYAEMAALTDEMITDTSDAAVPVRGGSKGLDSTGTLNTSEEAQLKTHMRAYAKKYQLLLIASGETDLCTDGERLIEIAAGTAALRRITGAGCLSTAVLAAFLAAERFARGSAGSAADDLNAAAAAVRYIGTAGEYALKACRETGTGAGHFHMYFMDMLGASDPVWE